MNGSTFVSQANELGRVAQLGPDPAGALDVEDEALAALGRLHQTAGCGAPQLRLHAVVPSDHVARVDDNRIVRSEILGIDRAVRPEHHLALTGRADEESALTTGEVLETTPRGVDLDVAVGAQIAPAGDVETIGDGKPHYVARKAGRAVDPAAARGSGIGRDEEGLAAEHAPPERLHQSTGCLGLDADACRRGHHGARLGSNRLARGEHAPGDCEAGVVTNRDIHLATLAPHTRAGRHGRLINRVRTSPNW